MKSPKRVAPDDRSRHAAEARTSALRQRDHLLARAAEAANRSRDVRTIEREFNRLETGIVEPWDEPPSR
jgi:hypothetical protein